MTQKPLNIRDIKDLIYKSFADAAYGGLTKTEVELKEVIETSLRQAMEAVDPKMMEGPVNEDMMYGYAACKDDLKQNMANFFNHEKSI